MIEKWTVLCGALDKIPGNIHAVFLIAVGALLVVAKHEQAGSGLMMTGATIFTHK